MSWKCSTFRFVADISSTRTSVFPRASPVGEACQYNLSIIYLSIYLSEGSIFQSHAWQPSSSSIRPSRCRDAMIFRASLTWETARSVVGGEWWYVVFRCTSREFSEYTGHESKQYNVDSCRLLIDTPHGKRLFNSNGRFMNQELNSSRRSSSPEGPNPWLSSAVVKVLVRRSTNGPGTVVPSPTEVK